MFSQLLATVLSLNFKIQTNILYYPQVFIVFILIFLFLGFICGVVALFVAYFTKALSNFKFKVFHNLIEKEKTGELIYGVAFLFFISCNCLFVAIAWMFVYIEPLAAGSGIPEVKCFLNGLNIPRVVRVKTLMYVRSKFMS